MKKRILAVIFAVGLFASIMPGVALASPPDDSSADANCVGQRTASLNQEHGSQKAAADAFDMTVKELRQLVKDSCNDHGGPA